MTNKFGAIPIWLLLSLFAVSHTTETVCTAALPAIAHEFHILGGIAQTSSSVYFLGFALGIMSLGRISDLIGRRPIVLGGLVLYVICTIACSFAENIETLLALRFVQAFGASVGSVISQAMARDSYRGSQLSQAYVSVSLSLSFIPALGSLVGGYIVENAGWVYNFRFLSVMVMIILIISFLRLPETNRYMAEARMVRYFEVLKSILTNRTVLLYAFIVGSFNGIMFGFFIEAPFIFIEKFKFAPSSYGKLSLLLAGAQLIGSFLTRQLVQRGIDNKKVITVGLSLSLMSCSILIANVFWMEANISQLAAVLLIFGPMMAHNIGHTLSVPLILRFALEDYSKVTGTAGSIFGSLYYIWVAVINFTISYLHGSSIMPFATLVIILSASCFMAFFVIQRTNGMVNERFSE